MKQKILSISLMLGSLVIAATALLTPVVASTPVYAQSSPSSPSQDKVKDGLDSIGDAFPAGAKSANYDVQTTVKKVINWALYLAAIAAVIFIIIGGYMYIFSAGDAGKATKGRTTMVNALIGLTLIVLSYLIVQIVYSFLTTQTTT